MARIVASIAVVLCSACSSSLAPYPEADVTVDTDLPVPLLAARLRVDLYDASGTWFESRDVARLDPLDWPVSFAVESHDEARTTDVMLRLRVYPEGGVRDYRGERFGDRTAPPASDLPILPLLDGDAARTPKTEPAPNLAVDRLVLLHLVPGEVGAARVVLRGACAGTMARLGMDPQSPRIDEATTCTDTEDERVPIAAADDALPVEKTFGDGDSCGPDEGADRVCVPAGVFILGGLEASGFDPKRDSSPARVAVMSRFWMDRHEVTVGRYRAALDAGFDPDPLDMPYPNNGPLDTSLKNKAKLCAYSLGPMGREQFGVSCIRWSGARAFCQAEGGDLPSEAQLEYAAVAAGRDRKALHVWGDATPSCSLAVYDRTYGIANIDQAAECNPMHDPNDVGPLPVDARPADTSAIGIVGLAGGLSEWAVDQFEGYDSACWRATGLHDPSCDAAGANRSFRGAGWSMGSNATYGVLRNGAHVDAFEPGIGFRCVYGSP